MGENVSFKFAHLADSNSAELSKMELTNAAILGDKGFFPLFFNEYKKDSTFFLQRTTSGDMPENSGSLTFCKMEQNRATRILNEKVRPEPNRAPTCHAAKAGHLEELQPWVKPLWVFRTWWYRYQDHEMSALADPKAFCTQKVALLQLFCNFWFFIVKPKSAKLFFSSYLLIEMSNVLIFFFPLKWTALILDSLQHFR